MTLFKVDNRQFLMDGQPFRIISGAMHYFRIVPEYWQDRLEKLKALGCNTVETYIAWNVHEPVEGHFDFAGIADVVRFVEIAQALGLYVIIRPSPYICAEWEFGGLPAWLLADPGMTVRCSHEPFLAKVDRYYDKLLPLLLPLQCTNGGAIIAMQIENEYGSYGNDTNYLQYLEQALLTRGVDVPLFTSDGPVDFLLQGGMVPGVLETVNFGEKPREAFELLQQYQPDGPLMCTEFWDGHFDHWGEEHHRRDAGEIAALLDEILSLGASVNLYMFHGGSNFGFYNGANIFDDVYLPTITSYDYDAPLNEAGDPTEKYEAIRQVIAKHVVHTELGESGLGKSDLGELDLGELPLPMKKQAYGAVAMTEQAYLFDSLEQLSSPQFRVTPEPMEMLGQSYGFILYSTRISGPREENELIIQEVRDRALVYVDGVYQGVIERADKSKKVKLAIPQGGAELCILVENMGRVNFGPYVLDRKGITEGVRFGNQYLFGWTIHTLPLQDLNGLAYRSGADGQMAEPGQSGQTRQAGLVEASGRTKQKEAPEEAGQMAEPGNRGPSGPSFYRGTFQVGEPADTFLDTRGWTKGVAYINGFNLGRYWQIGPQKTLYIPAPLLRTGTNELILFELHEAKDAQVYLTDTANLG